jgi:hypothetical protein
MIDLSKNDEIITTELTVLSLGVTVRMKHRLPDTEEVRAYRNETYRANADKDGKKNPQLDYGLAILTGIQDGDFGIDGKPLSSDPASPDYKENWKDLLKLNKTAARMICELANIAFDGTLIRRGGDEKEVPFVKS